MQRPNEQRCTFRPSTLGKEKRQFPLHPLASFDCCNTECRRCTLQSFVTEEAQGGCGSWFSHCYNLCVGRTFFDAPSNPAKILGLFYSRALIPPRNVQPFIAFPAATNRSAFRDTLLPTDRSTVTSIHTIIAAEAIIRYDEEHQKPPETSSLEEESSYYGGDGRIAAMWFVLLDRGRVGVGVEAEFRYEPPPDLLYPRIEVCTRSLESSS